MAKGVEIWKNGMYFVFREPFPHKDPKGLRILVGKGKSEHEILITSEKQIQVLNKLIEDDGKLLNAVVKVVGQDFVVVKHSPQSDFFKEVDKCTQ